MYRMRFAYGVLVLSLVIYLALSTASITGLEMSGVKNWFSVVLEWVAVIMFVGAAIPVVCSFLGEDPRKHNEEKAFRLRMRSVMAMSFVVESMSLDMSPTMVKFLPLVFIIGGLAAFFAVIMSPKKFLPEYESDGLFLGLSLICVSDVIQWRLCFRGDNPVLSVITALIVFVVFAVAVLWLTFITRPRQVRLDFTPEEI
jgi:hypothetical protein